MINHIIFNEKDIIDFRKEHYRKYFLTLEDGSEFQYKDVKNIKIECKECGRYTEIKKLNTRFFEKEYICKSCNHKGEKNPMYGKTFTEEVKKKMSERNSGEGNPFYGKKHSDEAKKKISKANKGKLVGSKNPMYGVNVYEQIEQISGTTVLNEIKKRISEKCSGEKNGFYGKTHSEETRKHLSETLKNSEVFQKHIHSKEYREKISKIMKNSEKLKESRSSEEYKQKLREASANYLLRKREEGFDTSKDFQANFNIKACKYFDKLMKETGTNIQHALNGGEYVVKKYCYFLDGYDKDNNIVYEYDEKSHYDSNGNLKEKDIIRQNNIIKELGCKFIRIKEDEIS